MIHLFCIILYGFAKETISLLEYTVTPIAWGGGAACFHNAPGQSISLILTHFPFTIPCAYRILQNINDIKHHHCRQNCIFLIIPSGLDNGHGCRQWRSLIESTNALMEQWNGWREPVLITWKEKCQFSRPFSVRFFFSQNSLALFVFLFFFTTNDSSGGTS